MLASMVRLYHGEAFSFSMERHTRTGDRVLLLSDMVQYASTLREVQSGQHTFLMRGLRTIKGQPNT